MTLQTSPPPCLGPPVFKSPPCQTPRGGLKHGGKGGGLIHGGVPGIQYIGKYWGDRGGSNITAAHKSSQVLTTFRLLCWKTKSRPSGPKAGNDMGAT